MEAKRFASHPLLLSSLPFFIKRLVLATVLLAGVGARAAGPSFDCGKAESAIERAVCASPQLSDSDSAVALAYKRALASLGPDGAAQLRTSQRNWLAFLKKACAPAGPSGPVNMQCLTNAMDSRPAELDQAGWVVGPYRLTRVDLYEVLPGAPHDSLDADPNPAVHHVAFPQIEAAKTRAAIAWNDQHRLTPNGDASTDTEVGYFIRCAGDTFVSIETYDYEYGHGTPHGMSSGDAFNQVLVPEVHDLTLADLFAPGVDWQALLPDLFEQAYDRTKDPERDTPQVRDLVRGNAVSGPWALTPEGLTLVFSSYDGGCYACTPQPPVVKWADLKALLVRPETALCMPRALPKLQTAAPTRSPIASKPR